MKRKTGVVVKVDKDYVCVRTVKGEFFNLKRQSYTPNIGDIYSGALLTPKATVVRRIIGLAIIGLIILFGSNIYYFFTPSASVVLTIPPTIQLKVNKWNKIVSIKPTSTSARNLVAPIKLKNKSIDKGLELIVEEAKKQNIINKNYIDSENMLTIYIAANDDEAIQLINFKSYLKDRKINYRINNNGSEHLVD
ncbi:anti-sigma-I factor RsgI family protein [Clostridium sp. JNZ J1-5]